jgi:hypothetical protein
MATISVDVSNTIVIAGNLLNQPRQTRTITQATPFSSATFNGISLAHRPLVTPSQFSLIGTSVVRDAAGNSLLSYTVRNDNPPGLAPGIPGPEVEFIRTSVFVGP